MWDAIFYILLCNINWWMYFEYVAITGLPFAFFVMSILWYSHMFPSSMYTSFDVNIIDVIKMIFLIDLIQTYCHYAAHTYLCDTFVGKSHMIHHKHRDPKPQDAFYTGYVDALIQLLLPLYMVLCMVQPSRYSAILFGVIYSWWLLFIHSDSKKEYSYLEHLKIVTPKYHNEHHQNPRTNFSNVLALKF